MLLSNTYYRFSEYKCITTFMSVYYPELLSFYPFHEYGKKGIRYRESSKIIEDIKNFCKENKLTYEIFKSFIRNTFDEEYTYIQLEHVI